MNNDISPHSSINHKIATSRAVWLTLGLFIGGVIISFTTIHLFALHNYQVPVITERLRVLSQNPSPLNSIDTLIFSVYPQKPSESIPLLPAGVSIIYGFYQLKKPINPAFPLVKWSTAGAALPAPEKTDFTIDTTTAGQGRFMLRFPGGSFKPGIYEVEVQYGDKRLCGSFQVAWGAEQILAQKGPTEAEVHLSTAVMALGLKNDGSPQAQIDQLRGDVERVFFVFRYAAAESGLSISVKWFLDGQEISAARREIILRGSSGWANAWFSAQPGIPHGKLRAVAYLTGDNSELVSTELNVSEK